jgi:hypothetical protein
MKKQIVAGIIIALVVAVGVVLMMLVLGTPFIMVWITCSTTILS